MPLTTREATDAGTVVKGADAGLSNIMMGACGLYWLLWAVSAFTVSTTKKKTKPMGALNANGGSIVRGWLQVFIAMDTQDDDGRRQDNACVHTTIRFCARIDLRIVFLKPHQLYFC